MVNKLSFKRLISVDQLQKKDIDLIFKTAEKIKTSNEKGRGTSPLRRQILAALFYEPSSRTFSSFASAMQRLGGGLISYQNMEHSSISKGETFEDTIKTFSELSDIIVIRHSESGSARKASLVSKVPIINAGDGAGEHPTQALLDGFTIASHFSNFKKITIGLVGDLKYGRTVHSLTKLLLKMGVKKFIWVSPNALKMPNDVYKLANRENAEILQSEKLDENIKKPDVLYVTRVQKERFDNLKLYKKFKNIYVIDKNLLANAKSNMVLMHPLPRVGEINPDVDSDSRSLYFREQISNGLYVRMALLDLMLNK